MVVVGAVVEEAAGRLLEGQLVLGELEIHAALYGRRLCEADAVDLTPTVAQEGFRADVRAWLVANLPWEYGKGLPPRFEDLSAEVAFGRSWQASLAEGGWVGVAWPTEYGGRGAGAAEHFIVQEELARARAPEMVGRIGLNLAAPTLLAHGTEEQKARWLSRIRTAEDLWCQLFSEPGAGSDLAGLSTRAAAPRGLAGQRPEGLDLLRPVRRLGRLPRPHRPRRSQAQGASPTWSSTCATPASRSVPWCS